MGEMRGKELQLSFVNNRHARIVNRRQQQHQQQRGRPRRPPK